MGDYGQERFELIDDVDRLEAYVDRIETYVATSLNRFVGDPPDSDFQSGYLAALKAVATEGMGVVLAHEIARIDVPAEKPVLRVITGGPPPWSA